MNTSNLMSHTDRNKKFHWLSITIRTACLLLVLITAFALKGFGQTKITFKVDLTPQLEDCVFIPDRDQIYLKGDVFPLSSSQKIYLRDTAPADSIYEARVNFPPTASNRRLIYNFYIRTPEQTLSEQMERQLGIGSKDQELNALYFNSFAW